MVKLPFPCCCGTSDACWQCIDSYPRQIVITEIPANRAGCYGTAAGTYDIPAYGTSDPSSDDVGFGVSPSTCSAFLSGFPSETGSFSIGSFQQASYTADQFDFWVPYDPTCPPILSGQPNPLFGTIYSAHAARKKITITVSAPRTVTVIIETSELMYSRPLPQPDCIGDPPDQDWNASRTEIYEIDLETCPDEGFAVPFVSESHTLGYLGLVAPIGTPPSGWSDPNPHYSIYISVLPPIP